VAHQVARKLELLLEGMAGVELKAIADGRERFECSGGAGGDGARCRRQLADMAARIGAGHERGEVLEDLAFGLATNNSAWFSWLM
jgi:hypothetical protein